MSVDLHCIRTVRKTSSLETSSGELTSKAACSGTNSRRITAQGSLIVTLLPWPCHWRMACSSNQSPVRLRMKSVVAPSPASLVKPAANASLVTIGAASSTPTSDHVPEDTKAVLCRQCGAT